MSMKGAGRVMELSGALCTEENQTWSLAGQNTSQIFEWQQIKTHYLCGRRSSLRCLLVNMIEGTLLPG